MSKKYLIIEADINDGDIINSRHEISDEQIELIKPVIQAIKDFDDDKSIKYQKYNWWNHGHRNSSTPEQYMSPQKRYVDKGKCSQEAFDYFNDLTPSLDNEDIHTIDSIRVLTVIKEERLL